MRRLWKKAALLLAAPLSMVGSCGPIPDYRTLTEVDLHPPEFRGLLATDARTLVLRFDEPVHALAGSVGLYPPLAVAEVSAEAETLIVRLSADQEVGGRYTIEASVEDEDNNSTSVVATFYGFNPDLPEMLISEFTTQGSSTHPDVVELAVTAAGNTAGMCLYEGVPSNWDDRKILPPIRVVAGDFLVVHFKPEGLPEEVDETDVKDASGGRDASPVAYDLWIAGGSGLAGNNGVLALSSCPGGKILDAALYSNRTSASDTDYLGFGTKEVYERVVALEPTGQWRSSGEHIAPEDGVDPDPSTATRSICRSSTLIDTNAKSDWHIVPTGGASFGTVNSDEVYLP